MKDGTNTKTKTKTKIISTWKTDGKIKKMV
jgi:hypothetical protein